MGEGLSHDQLEFFNERAAIREFCGGQDRQSAEQSAMAEVEEMFRCEVRSVLAKAHQHGQSASDRFLLLIETKRGSAAAGRLRAAAKEQWIKGNRGERGDWR